MGFLKYIYIFISKYYTPYHLNWLSCQQYIQVSESNFRCWYGWEQGNLKNTQKELCWEIHFFKKCCFKRIFKGVVFPPSGSAVVNDRRQGHFREWVQFCLVQSLDKDRAKQLEWRVCKGCREAGCEQSCGCPSQGQHWGPVTPTKENMRKAFAGFGMVQPYCCCCYFEIFWGFFAFFFLLKWNAWCLCVSREIEYLLLSFPANCNLVWWHWCNLEFCKLGGQPVPRAAGMSTEQPRGEK